METYILAIDQGTTGSRAVLINQAGEPVSTAYRPIQQIYPQPAWVEHDPGEIWKSVQATVGEAIAYAGVGRERITALGITNQRETTILWDRDSGEPIHNAIVWQCRRTAEECDRLRRKGAEKAIRRKTGLPVDAYFSGPKIAWILDRDRHARKLAEEGKILFGTVDSWLIWRLSGGTVHATDYTNASRTMLLDIRNRSWDREMLELLRVPAACLPVLVPSSGIICYTKGHLLGDGLPIAGVAGDQQAALFGQHCWRAGMIKNTYGTGCFLLLYTGTKPIWSRNGLLTTIACGSRGEPHYALEGSVFVAGAAIQWLRDNLCFFQDSAQSEQLALDSLGKKQVYVVPAFAGLGAPYWDMHARGAILGLTRDTSKADITCATLEAIAYQTRDVIEAMKKDTRLRLKELRVDGGASANNFLLQFQADILGTSVSRPEFVETTALGAAYLAGLALGFWKSTSELEGLRREGRVFLPQMPARIRQEKYEGWRAAVGRVRTNRSKSR